MKGLFRSPAAATSVHVLHGSHQLKNERRNADDTSQYGKPWQCSEMPICEVSACGEHNDSKTHLNAEAQVRTGLTKT